MATQTWTLDTAGMKYIDKDKIEHVITTSQAFTLDFTDTGVGGNFIGLVGGNPVGCTDGFKFTIEADPAFSFLSSADGSATTENGTICFVEQNFRHLWKVISLNLSNADGTGANNISSITMESLSHGLQMTWTNIDTA